MCKSLLDIRFEAVYWQTSWCHRGFNLMVVTTIFAHTTFLWAKCCLICFISIVKRSWQTDLYGSYHLSNLEIGLTASVTGQQGILTPPWHLIPLPIFRGLCTLILWFVFPIGLVKLNFSGLVVLVLRGCSMATSILHSQNFRFQITIYLEGNWDFLKHKHSLQF
jgi:hypothetical protein